MEALTVGDVMTSDVAVVNPETPFKDVVQVMLQRRVSGVPVVDGAGTIVGIVTEADLLRAGTDPVDGSEQPRGLFPWRLHPKRLGEIERAAEGLRAADVMTRDPLTMTPETPLREAIRSLVDAGVKRFPVVDEDRRVVGIVSRPDLLRPMLRPDDAIAREIEEDVLLHTMWIDPSSIAITVDRGIVTLEGRVGSRTTKEIMVRSVGRVNGVIRVVDRLTYSIDDRKTPPVDPLRWGENWTRLGR